MTDARTEGAALWQRFNARMAALGEIVQGAAIAEEPVDQAEGYRYLTRLTRIALRMYLENANADFPSFYPASDSTAKIGADNPDNAYLNATISGRNRYRIWGKRGTIPILSFISNANRYATEGTMASTGELDSANMEVAADGSFEIIASKEKANGNWLPLADDTDMLIVRRTFLDRATEVLSEVHIEAITSDKAARPRALTLEELDTALGKAAAFVEGTAKTFLRWADVFRKENCNTLDTVDQTMFLKGGGDPTIFYLHGYWKLAPDEALEIRTRIPECIFWNFQLDNVWMESLDYRSHRIHVNAHSAKLDDDGTVTIVVAARDPGHANWIETAGHGHGTMLLRWTGTTDHPVPETRVVKI